ncbi:MAG: YCF48-related protein [Pirellulales bacterium]
MNAVIHHFRCACACRLALLASLASLAALALSARPGPAFADNARPIVANSLRSDAALWDICFVDQQYGWAVGDRGTVWYTEDGGQRWRLQESGVDAQLRGVRFIDSQNGWIVGGRSTALSGQTVGVLLRTRDGGQTWTTDEGLLLPSLRKIGFFSHADGWAVGEPSALFPSGVFTTDNGGRTWAPVPGNGGWLAGDFIDQVTGAVAGRRGSLAVIRNRGLDASTTPPLGMRGLRQLILAEGNRGWLVGDGSLVMNTTDRGATWQTPDSPLPDAVSDQFDWQALAVREGQCWIAGAPGTRILHSPDEGRTWTMQATGQPLPIHALAFIDGRRGWAAGALGTILATEDGGTTWQRQRCGGIRAALAGFYAEPEEIPLELLARLSGNDGYLGVVELLARRDLENETPRNSAFPQRAHEAVVAVGACQVDSSWRFPLRQAGLELSLEQVRDGWDRVNDGAGIDRLERHIVRQLRIWRPDLVFAPPANLRNPDPLAQLVSDAVFRAVAKAADSTSYAEQLAEQGLEPWKVKKVFATSGQGDSSTISLTTAQIAPRLGGSLADRAATARSLFQEDPPHPPASLGFRLMTSALPADLSRGDFFSGVTLSPGGEARRTLENPPVDNLEGLRRSAQKHRNVQSILERVENDAPGGARLAGQVHDLVGGLEGEEAGNVLHQLAGRYHRHGRWDMAAETLESFVTRYPKHRLVPAAQIWLVQYYSSDEAAWRMQQGQRGSFRTASAQVPAAARNAGTRAKDDGVKPASFELDETEGHVIMADQSVMEERWKKASELAKNIERTSPTLFAEPSLRFPLAVAHRRQGYSRQAERFYLAMRHGSADEMWSACAVGERWLAEPQGRPPKAIVRCRRGTSKPRLDGQLDEPMWSPTEKADLHSALRDDGEWPATALFSYDEEFLYLGIRCRRAPGAVYEAGAGPRPRDADLAGRDRVEICLDLDRDAATYYRLTVDHRGFTADECWGDRSWDPQWFVAAAQSEESWTIEAAIPLIELTGQKPTHHSAWSVGVQRIVPGVGFQSWTTPAGIEVQPQGFGYLLFD